MPGPGGVWCARFHLSRLMSCARERTPNTQLFNQTGQPAISLPLHQTPEGLRIQLIDQEGRSMFEPNSSRPNERARLLLRAVSRVIVQLPNRVTIAGHTSATPGVRNPADWPLSAGRADAARAILQSAGVDPDRVYQVSGKANSDPLYPDDPTLAGNRRIAIVLLREAPVLPSDSSL